jgi:hypothetical protein
LNYLCRSLREPVRALCFWWHTFRMSCLLINLLICAQMDANVERIQRKSLGQFDKRRLLRRLLLCFCMENARFHWKLPCFRMEISFKMTSILQSDKNLSAHFTIGTRPEGVLK